jgi:hypothetical protein
VESERSFHHLRVRHAPLRSAATTSSPALAASPAFDLPSSASLFAWAQRRLIGREEIGRLDVTLESDVSIALTRQDVTCAIYKALLSLRKLLGGVLSTAQRCLLIATHMNKLNPQPALLTVSITGPAAVSYVCVNCEPGLAGPLASASRFVINGSSLSLKPSSPRTRQRLTSSPHHPSIHHGQRGALFLTHKQSDLLSAFTRCDRLKLMGVNEN